MKYIFVLDDFLEIKVPNLIVPYEEFSEKERENFYLEAKKYTSSKIPSKILELDKEYMNLYDKLGDYPEDFFEIMDELNEISKKISALNALFLQIEGYFIQSSNYL